MSDVIRELRELLDKATPAPWVFVDPSNRTHGEVRPHFKNADYFDWVGSVQVSNVNEWRENAALIVAAVNALPALLAIAEAAEATERMLNALADFAAVSLNNVDEGVLAIDGVFDVLARRTISHSNERAAALRAALARLREAK